MNINLNLSQQIGAAIQGAVMQKATIKEATIQVAAVQELPYFKENFKTIAISP